MLKRLPYLFTWAIVAGLLLSNTATASILVDVAWLKKHMNDPDVRVVGVYKKGASFNKGHIPGSVKVDRAQDLRDHHEYPAYAMPRPEQFVQVMKRIGVDNDTTVVIYDDSYQFASRLFLVMEYYGHDLEKLKILDGGLTAWKAAGEPVSTEITTVSAKADYQPSAPHGELIATRGDIVANISRNSEETHALVDVRPKKEWDGTKVRAIRTGHIPKAVHHSGVDEFMDKQTHKFRSNDDLEFALAEKGVTKDKTVYVYCQGGARAPHAYVAMKHILGYPDVRVYDRGWVEWANLTAMPVADEKWIFQTAQKD